jgi:lipopolysaccharide/colanic/teichoic acid biosynthesis glycosyltransferase
MGVMAVLSGPAGSEESMRRGLTWLLAPLSSWFGDKGAGQALSLEAVWTLRKLLHLLEYALLAWLAFRWVYSLRPARFEFARAAALGLCFIYACSDETHQALVANRTGSPVDVAIDLLGAALTLSVVALVRTEQPYLSARILDICAAIIGLLLTVPFLVIAALAVWLNLGPPVFFRQQRIGKDDRLFTLLKFRTMRPQPVDGPRQTNRQRLTPTGWLLRALSIDEFPQFWNMLRGDMSLVGPRPLLPGYLPYYTPRERMRHRVRPGLTGLAQVSGRNALRWDDRLELDAQYVERKSLVLDFWIIRQTMLKVVQRSDVLDNPVEGSLIAARTDAQLDKPLA